MGKYNFGEDEDYLLNNNLVNVNNFEDLELVEQFTFTVRALEFENGLFEMKHFDFNELLSLDHFLFQDIYSFAGKVREVQLIKGNTQFCQMQYIESECQRIFEKLSKETVWKDVDQAASRLAYYKSELNMVHPFREGNGRTIRLFVYALAKSKSFIWDYSSLNHDEYLDAMIQAKTNTAKLELLFEKTLTKISY